MKTLTRRNVIATLGGSAVMLCPALLNAATTADLSGWDGLPTTEPVGMDRILNVDAGPATIDIGALGPGEVAVIGRPNDAPAYAATQQVQYVGVLRRTDAQKATAAIPGAETSDYLVVELVCPHRGKAVGLTGDPAVPFACVDRGRRHSSEFNAGGVGIAGASDGDPMTVPGHTINASGGSVVLELA